MSHNPISKWKQVLDVEPHAAPSAARKSIPLRIRREIRKGLSSN